MENNLVRNEELEPPLGKPESGKKKSGAKRCIGVIILVVVIVGICVNFYKSCKYASGSDVFIARAVGKDYPDDVTRADRFNVGIGYFITLGIAPKGGADAVANLNPWTQEENTPEAKALLELKHKAYNDPEAAIEYFKRHGNSN